MASHPPSAAHSACAAGLIGHNNGRQDRGDEPGDHEQRRKGSQHTPRAEVEDDYGGEDDSEVD
jgi:hypothetical protein